MRDRRQQDRPAEIDGIMIHRTGVDLKTGVVIGYDGVSVCDAFTGRAKQWAAVAKVTGSQNPYTFLVGGDGNNGSHDGVIWQALPTHEVGWHARRFSLPYVGVAMIGDFREASPTVPQWESAVYLVSELVLALKLSVSHVLGHGEVDGAHSGKKAPGQPHACPGDLWQMDDFRRNVNAALVGRSAHYAKERLARLGVSI